MAYNKQKIIEALEGYISTLKDDDIKVIDYSIEQVTDSKSRQEPTGAITKIANGTSHFSLNLIVESEKQAEIAKDYV
ncbi:MAG: hypothetical protein AAF348_07420 [Bacteroidota bacterium]